MVHLWYTSDSAAIHRLVFKTGEKPKKFFSKPVLRTNFSEEIKHLVSRFEEKYHLTNLS
jgi:hypothetical protein